MKTRFQVTYREAIVAVFAFLGTFAWSASASATVAVNVFEDGVLIPGFPPQPSPPPGVSLGFGAGPVGVNVATTPIVAPFVTPWFRVGFHFGCSPPCPALAGSHTFEIHVTQVGLTGFLPGLAFMTEFNLVNSNANVASVVLSAYLDVNNTPFATTTLLGTHTGTGDGTFNVIAPFSGNLSTFSETYVAVFSFTDNPLGGFSTQMQTFSVPEPSTWAMLLIGFAGLGFAFRHSAGKRRAVGFDAAI